jgi:hypothetical protein
MGGLILVLHIIITAHHILSGVLPVSMPLALYIVHLIGMERVGTDIVDMALAGEVGMEDGMVEETTTGQDMDMVAAVYIEAQAQGKAEGVIYIKEDKINALGVL